MTTIITAQQAVLDGDTLVMLVKKQQVHLGMALTLPTLKARLTLCGHPVEDGEVIGAVVDDDLALLQDFTICHACAAKFMVELRVGMLAKVRDAQLSAQPQQCTEALAFEANQLQLF